MPNPATAGGVALTGGSVMGFPVDCETRRRLETLGHALAATLLWLVAMGIVFVVLATMPLYVLKAFFKAGG